MSNQISNGTIKISYKKYELFFMAIDIDHLIERFSDEDHLKSFQEIARVTKEARYIFKQNKVYLVINTKENTTSICFVNDIFIRIKTCYYHNKIEDKVQYIMANSENLKTNKSIEGVKTEKVTVDTYGQALVDLIDDGTFTEKQIIDMFNNPKKWKRVK